MKKNILFVLLFFMYMSVYLCMLCVSPWRTEEDVRSLELELQAAYSCLTGVLRTKHRSPGRAMCAVNC